MHYVFYTTPAKVVVAAKVSSARALAYSDGSYTAAIQVNEMYGWLVACTHNGDIAWCAAGTAQGKCYDLVGL